MGPHGLHPQMLRADVIVRPLLSRHSYLWEGQEIKLTTIRTMDQSASHQALARGQEKNPENYFHTHEGQEGDSE